MPRYRVKHVAYYRYEHVGEYDAVDPADARRQAVDHASSCDFWDYAEQVSRPGGVRDDGTWIRKLELRKETQP